MNSKKKRKIFIALTMVMLLVIWTQSAFSPEQSIKESSWVIEHVIRPIANWLGLDSISGFPVRKLAHVFEFLLLGALISLLWPGKWMISGLVCFCVAFLDESIQLLSRRGSKVLDVWIDLIGATGGILLICFLRYLRSRSNKQKTQE